MNETMNLSRRGFLAAATAAAAGAAARAASPAARPAEKKQAAAPGALITSAPILQNAAETSMGVAFTVSADASGWVEYSESPSMANPKRAYSGGSGLMKVDPDVAQIRLRGLKPATRYWYRIGADRIDYGGGYRMKNLGPEISGDVHSFRTLGAPADGSFCVINDTHAQKPALAAVFKKIEELKPAAVIWNGDASNTSETLEDAKSIFVHPHPDFPAYAADTPYMFINGNHDFRGRYNRTLCNLMMFREPAERDPEFAELGRNFAQRLGDIALIGMDTGEDKVDEDPRFAGIFRMKEYRELQTEWLAKAIETPAVKTAKFKIVFCHIPLYCGDPRQNPGDATPAQAKAARYYCDYAYWQRTCARMWSPLFEKAGVRLVVAGHLHRFEIAKPAAGRTWTQIVGGGNSMSGRGAEQLFPTVIEGKCAGGSLLVKVHDVMHNRIAAELKF